MAEKLVSGTQISPTRANDNLLRQYKHSGYRKNPLYHKRTKHIDTKFHWICEKVQIGRISVESCRTDNQTADILTKPLTRDKHIKHVTGMGLAPI